MARFLTILRSIVPATERAEFLKRIRDRRSHFERSGCRSWSFEEVGLAGAVIEFVEAGEEAVLIRALHSAPGSAGENARIYKELEQS